MSDIVYNSVQEMRKRCDMTQQQVSERVGVTRQTIIAIEKGNYTPSVLLAIKIASIFKKPIEEIFYINKDDKK